MKGNEPIFLYDGVCLLCDGAVQFTLAHEKTPSIVFVAIQSEIGRELAFKHGQNPDSPESFLFIENGVAFEQSNGAIALAAHLRGFLPSLLRGCRFIPRPLRDMAYRLVARNRYKVFGKRPSCIIPDGESQHRFIL